MKWKLAWGYFVPPLFSLLIAMGVVWNQTSRHETVSANLAAAKKRVETLAERLPESERARYRFDGHSKEECEDHKEHDEQGHKNG